MKVLQDILSLRMDKIRQNFHELSQEELQHLEADELPMVNVTGIASVELNQVGPFLQRAFSDYGYLIRKSKDSETDEAQQGEKVVHASQRAMANKAVLAASRNKLRRFREQPAAHKE